MSEEQDEEMSPDLKHDIKLAFNLYKNDKNRINKLKLRTMLFSFVMYKCSAGDINEFIEENIKDEWGKEKEWFSYDEVCKLVNAKIKNARDKEADEIYSYLINIGSNHEKKLTMEESIKKAFEDNQMKVSDAEIKEMLEYMEGKKEEDENGENQQEQGESEENESENDKKAIEISREQFKKFYTDKK